MAKLDPGTLVQMGREYPDIAPGGIAERMQDIGKLAQQHQTRCENYCNVTDYNPNLIDRTERRLADLVGFMFPGTTLICQRDPRGATVKLLPPSGATNDWGREGLCVLE